MIAAYLWLNAALYAVFALWSTLQPSSTASALGLLPRDGSGRSEYLVVYGGLQLGLAAIFAYLAATPQLQRPGLHVALLLYVPIVLYRGVTLAGNWPVGGTTKAVAGLEAALLVGGLLIFCWTRGAR